MLRLSCWGPIRFPAAIPSQEVPTSRRVPPIVAYKGTDFARKGRFFQASEREVISLIEVYERVGKSVIWVC